MHVPVFEPDGSAVVEVATRVESCVVAGCGGQVVRHSLGGGQAILRCTGCFRRYQVRDDAALTESRLRRLLNDFTSWRDA